MQRLYIERFYLNRADDEYPMTVRIILQMKDDVDRHLFEEAVAAAQTRYPYLCVKLGVERDADGSEHYVYNDNPMSLSPKPRVLLSFLFLASVCV